MAPRWPSGRPERTPACASRSSLSRPPSRPSRPRPPRTPRSPPLRPPPAMTEDQKVVYALGLAMGQRLGDFSLSPQELELLQKGVADSVLGRSPQVDLQVYGPKIMELAQARQQVVIEKVKKDGEAYLEQASQRPGAKKTASGIVYVEETGRHRRIAQADRQDQDPLPRHDDRRHRLRQLRRPRDAGRIRARQPDPLLGRGDPADESRRQGPAGLPAEPRLRRPRCAAGHQAGRDADVPARADRHRRLGAGEPPAVAPAKPEGTP